MEIIVESKTSAQGWAYLTQDQQAHMNKDFPSERQQDRIFFTHPADDTRVIPVDMFFGPVRMTIDEVEYHNIYTTGGVAYLVRFDSGGIHISLAVS